MLQVKDGQKDKHKAKDEKREDEETGADVQNPRFYSVWALLTNFVFNTRSPAALWRVPREQTNHISSHNSPLSSWANISVQPHFKWPTKNLSRSSSQTKNQTASQTSATPVPQLLALIKFYSVWWWQYTLRLHWFFKICIYNQEEKTWLGSFAYDFNVNFNPHILWLLYKRQ